MIKLRNEFGKIYYMTEEENGKAACTKFTKIQIVSEDFMDTENPMEYSSTYMNATDGPQPNIWTPYILKDNEVIIFDDYRRRNSYRYEIIGIEY